MPSGAQPAPVSREHREFARFQLQLPGKIFVPAEDATLDCRVTDLSGGGAGIQCDEPPPLQTFVVLYIDGFGRFEGVATRFVAGELGLRFVCQDAKRQRLLRDLTNFVVNGVTVPTQLRRHCRNVVDSRGHFTRPNGDQVTCEILDISLQGLSLRTQGRPPMGELVHIGQTYGRVVRHHAEGISVQFLNPASAPGGPHNGH